MSPIQDKFYRLLYKRAYSRAVFRLWGVTLMEVKVCFRQFFTWNFPLSSLFRTVTILFSSIVRLFLGRSLNYTFAFAGEDKIIEGILKPKITKIGFYVDVGCNHPKHFSNTYGLYRKGWRGICIDANQTLINKYGFYRPKDWAICSLISDAKEDKIFYQVENNVLSTTEEKFISSYQKEGLLIEAKIMTTQSLTEVLDKLHVPKEFDLLTVDVEEHDLQVLRSLDLSVYHPRLIIVEDETFEHLLPEKNEIYRYLNGHRYFLIGHVLKNLYFQFQKEEKQPHI